MSPESAPLKNDPRIVPMIPVEVLIDHRRPIFEVRVEEGIRPYVPPAVTRVVIRAWERASGQVVQYEGTLNDVVLRQEPPTPDDLEWLRAIGALEDAPPAKRHTLAEHVDDVEKWIFSRYRTIGREERDRGFFIAYERWLADRILLTEEDGRGSHV